MVLRISGSYEFTPVSLGKRKEVSVPQKTVGQEIKRDESEEKAVGGNGHFIMPVMDCVLFVYAGQQFVGINP